MRTPIFMAVTAITLLMAGCNAAYEKNDAASEKVSAPDAVSSSAAVEPNKETDRKFIRTSDMKFRVKDVAQATYQIEELTRNLSGFVTYTHLESTQDEKTVKPLSADSALETLHYTVVNNMTIRVPNVRLDSTLKAIAALVDYLDYRTIKADDVALQIKANQKTQARALTNGQRVRNAIDNQGRKLPETTSAEGLATDRLKEADEAEIANLSLQDQVNYSTVSLSLYQRAETKRWIVPNADNTDDYRPGLGLRIWESLKTGWRLVEDLLVLFTRLWLVLLLAAIGFLVYKNTNPGKYR